MVNVNTGRKGKMDKKACATTEAVMNSLREQLGTSGSAWLDAQEKRNETSSQLLGGRKIGAGFEAPRQINWEPT